jgi:hypothetical protein
MPIRIEFANEKITIPLNILDNKGIMRLGFYSARMDRYDGTCIYELYYAQGVGVQNVSITEIVTVDTENIENGEIENKVKYIEERYRHTPDFSFIGIVGKCIKINDYAQNSRIYDYDYGRLPISVNDVQIEQVAGRIDRTKRNLQKEFYCVFCDKETEIVKCSTCKNNALKRK